ncbi:MAG: formimidoylglutamate deiminase, partial [Acidimicrobiia bacterium]
MSAFHCELAWLGGAEAERDVLVSVAGERITAVEPSVTEHPEGATRLPGLTIPGLADAHSHAFHRALRGRTHAGPGSFWTWREQMYALAGSLDPDAYFELARATFAEMALAGISVVGEFHYLHHGPGGVPYDDPNAMGAAMTAAAADAGIRITLLDTCYLHGGIGAGLDDTQRRFADPDPLAWAERASGLGEGPGVRIGAAIHSVRAVDPAAMEVVGAWAAARGAPLHAHVSEQPAENEQCAAAYGRTPTG